MAEYRVVWEIDIDADSVEDAARKALKIQRDPSSTATVFDVTRGKKTKRVDLPAGECVPIVHRTESGVELTIKLDAHGLAVAADGYADSIIIDSGIDPLSPHVKVYLSDSHENADERFELAECIFLNHYVCPACGSEWDETWSCGCDSKCDCGQGDISPVSSELQN